MNLDMVDLLVFGAPALFMITWLIGDLYIVLFMRKKPGYQLYPTITWQIQILSSKYIVIPFLAGLIIGLLCGHLFGQF